MILDAALLARLMVCPDGPLPIKYLEPMNEALLRAQITTPLRLAHLVTQVGHECNGLRWMRELATGAEYEGRKDLGNTSPGDGVRYKGGGVIQITGKDNYLKFGIWIGVGDLFVRQPELVYSDPRNAVMTAPYYWETHNLNRLADADTGTTAEVTVRDRKNIPLKITANAALCKITRAVNGGYNGLYEPWTTMDRMRRFDIAKKALGI
jgi:putative chitinase